jgi:hypothetical protein
MTDLRLPDPDAFAKDPFGYSSLAWHKWGTIRTLNGFHIDISKHPTAEDLKDPLLWLTHASALAEAATCLVRVHPVFSQFPSSLQTISHSQYYAVALMLVGYSLEVSLKAMLLMRLGVDEFLAQEKKFLIHELNDLSDFITDLSAKDRAILSCLTHFVKWAGRYPDPGARRLDSAIDVFSLSETHRITAKDVFELSGRVMRHANYVVSGS